jgi:hypothetical protein
MNIWLSAYTQAPSYPSSFCARNLLSNECLNYTERPHGRDSLPILSRVFLSPLLFEQKRSKDDGLKRVPRGCPVRRKEVIKDRLCACPEQVSTSPPQTPFGYAPVYFHRALLSFEGIWLFRPYYLPLELAPRTNLSFPPRHRHLPWGSTYHPRNQLIKYMG